MSKPGKCEAKDPTTCRHHGTKAAAEKAVQVRDINDYFAAREADAEEKERQRAFIFGLIESELSKVEWDGYETKVRSLIHSLTEKYGTPKIGRTRAVFDSQDGNVIKVPFTDEGEMANGYEHKAGKEENPYIPVAANRFDKIDGVDILIMEKVKEYRFASYNDVPDWVGSVDSGQVGYDRNGKLVAYDL
jgi:hypothetical protein